MNGEGDKWDWVSEEVIGHVVATARALVFKKEGHRIVRRTPEEILKIYKDVVWTRELRKEDKLAFAKILLVSGNKKLWGVLRNKVKIDEEQLEPWFRGEELSEDCVRGVVNALAEIKDELLVIRWETIRNRFEPRIIEEEMFTDGF